jgi:uroporphyrin-III C-methyltransferase
VTAHVRTGEALELDWAALADPQATLAIYMGKTAAGEVSRQLLAHGLPADTPVAIVENASLPSEQTLTTRLDLLPLAARTCSGTGPALLLIGTAMKRSPLAEANALSSASNDFADRLR